MITIWLLSVKLTEHFRAMKIVMCIMKNNDVDDKNAAAEQLKSPIGQQNKQTGDNKMISRT